MAGTERFIRLPTALLEALLQTSLSGAQWCILGWVIRHTLGWNRTAVTFTWYRIAKDLGLDRAGVVRAARRLLHAGILYTQAEQIALTLDPNHWSARKLAPTGEKAMTSVRDDRRHLKAVTEIIATDDDCQRKRCQDSSLFRRAKDSSKDILKTYKHKPQKSSAGDTRLGASQHTERRSEAGAAAPVPGKYDRISQD